MNIVCVSNCAYVLMQLTPCMSFPDVICNLIPYVWPALFWFHTDCYELHEVFFYCLVLFPKVLYTTALFCLACI